MEREDELLAAKIIEAARSVHDSLGPGFTEPIYNKAFGIELRNRGFVVEREKQIRVVYASCIVGRHYLDLTVDGRVILELKATRAIIPVFEAQVMSYLTATDYAFGLVINFGMPLLEWKPILRSELR